jgi:hypothetical protein
MTFRDRLIGSLRVMQPVLDVPGVLVGGSQVPNLLEPAAASTLISSLTTISLMKPIPEMPDPVSARAEVARLVARLEATS